MSEERKKQLAFALIGVLAAVMVWRLFFNSQPEPSARSAAVSDSAADGSIQPLVRRGGGRGRQASAAPETLEVVALDLAALQPEAREYEIGRNLWRYHEPPPPPPPVVQRPPPTRVIRDVPPPVVQQPPRKQLPVADFRYLGSFGPRERKIAVLSDGQEIFNVFEGSVVKQEFVVSSIDLESIVLEYKNHPEEEGLRLQIGG